MNALSKSNSHEDQSGGNSNMGRSSSSVNETDRICFAIIRHNKENSTIKNIILLKQLFSKCLPKMSKQHILSTILHQDHINLIMIRDKSQLIGAITFRLFRKNQFNQIVLFAIQDKYQRKGFGTKLMNALKSNDMLKQLDEMLKIGIKNLLTYADDLAHIFFYRQGFSSKIALPNSQFQGLIKKYEGGTLMHCIIEQKKIEIQKTDNPKEQKVTKTLDHDKIIEEKQQKVIRNQNQSKIIEQKPIQEKQLSLQKKVKIQSVVPISKKQKKKNQVNSSLESNSLMRWIRKCQPIKTENPNHQ